MVGSSLDFTVSPGCSDKNRACREVPEAEYSFGSVGGEDSHRPTRSSQACQMVTDIFSEDEKREWREAEPSPDGRVHVPKVGPNTKTIQFCKVEMFTHCTVSGVLPSRQALLSHVLSVMTE